jgi:hypothetical protein
MSLYDREYMRDDKNEGSQTRRPGVVAEYRKTTSNRLGRGEQVGFVIAATGVILLLLGIAFL